MEALHSSGTCKNYMVGAALTGERFFSVTLTIEDFRDPEKLKDFLFEWVHTRMAMEMSPSARAAMWMLENPTKHEYGHTSYPAVADAYRMRPGYTVTAIYPRAGL